MVQVPYENVPDAIQPGLAEPQRIQSSPDAFGAQVGAAIQNLGRQLKDSTSELGSLYLRHNNRVQSSVWERQLQEFSDREQERFERERRSAAGTVPTGFSETFIERQRAEANRILATIPEAQRSQWASRYRAVESGFRPRALTAEFQIGDATSEVALNQTQERLRTRAYEDPSDRNRDSLYAQSDESINNSTIPEGQREAARARARQGIDRAIWQRRVADNPEQVAAITGGRTAYETAIDETPGGGTAPTESFLRDLDRTEGSTRNRASTANGYYQFLRGTWNGYANSERGRAAGLRPITRGDDPRRDREQARIAIRLFTEDSANVLRRNNIPITGQNLYMLHFLGNGENGGGIQFLRQLRSDPTGIAANNHPDAAASNPAVFYANSEAGRGPRTNAQLYAFATRRFGSGNPVVAGNPSAQLPASLTVEDRIQLRQQAETGVRRQQAEETARHNAQVSETYNNLSAGITDGRVGHAQVAHAWATGAITDNAMRTSLTRQIDTRDTALNSAVEYGRRIEAGNLNPQSPADRTVVNNNWDNQLRLNRGDRMATGMQMWEQTRGVMPTEGAAALMQAITSTNQQQVMGAMQHLMRIRASGYSTDQFAGMPNAAELREAADTAMFYSNINGGNLAEAAAVITQRNLPEHQRTNPGNRERTRQFTEQLQRTEASTIRGQINGWFASIRGEAGNFMPGQDQVALSDYIQFATDRYDRYGDAADARDYASRRVQQVWGNSNGWITRMPPERVFPEAILPDGTRSREYLYDQAQQVATRFMGRPVAREDIQLMPIPGVTARIWNQGPFTVEDIQSGRREAPPYGLVVRTPGPGGYFTAEIVPVPGTSLMIPFRADPNAVQTTREPTPLTRGRVQAEAEGANRVQYHYDNQLPLRMPDGQTRIPTEAEAAAARETAQRTRAPAAELDAQLTREQIARDSRTRAQQPGGDPAPRRPDRPTWPPTPQDGF